MSVPSSGGPPRRWRRAATRPSARTGPASPTR
jgi:hypothetical protein